MKIPYISTIFLLIFLFTPLSSTTAELCSQWSKPKKVGVIDHNLIDEASGIEASRRFPDRLYHINDSGGGQYFYITDQKGDNTQKIKINGTGVKRSDFEDISVGKCFDKTCIFIGDIGDNKARKYSGQIIIIEENKQYGSSVDPIKRLEITYPDGPHNAEGLAVHPNGDIYIVTKEENLRDFEAYPAKVYKLPKEVWENKNTKSAKLEHIGDIDLPSLNPSATAYGQVVSAFDIAPDGKKFLLLTYENAYEFSIDLATQPIKPTEKLVKGEDYNVIELKSLPQQESITYMPDGKSFLYNTEHHWFQVPIMRVDCQDK